MSIKDFLFVDFKDITNWIGILIAIPLLYWGVTTIINNISATQ